MNGAHTQIPNEFWGLLPELSPAELKILIYIYRYTAGFHRDSDTFTTQEFQTGKQLNNGATIDRGTGVSRTAVKKAISDLVEKGLISRFKQPGTRFTLYSTTIYGESQGQKVTPDGISGSESDPEINLRGQKTTPSENSQGQKTTPKGSENDPEIAAHNTPRASEKETERKKKKTPPTPPEAVGADAAAGVDSLSLPSDANAGPSPDLMDAGIENWIRDYAADRYCKASFKTKHRSFLESIDSRKTRTRIAEIINEAQTSGNKSNLTKKILEEFKWNPRKTYEPRAEKSTPARSSSSPSSPRGSAGTQHPIVSTGAAVGAESAFTDYSDDDGGWARLWREAKAELDGEREPDRDPKMEAMRLEIGIDYDEQCPEAVEAVKTTARETGNLKLECNIMTWKEFERVFTRLHDSCIPGRKDVEGKRRFKLAVKTYWETLWHYPEESFLWAVKEYVDRQGDKPFFPQLGMIMEIVDEPAKGEIYKSEPGLTPEQKVEMDEWKAGLVKEFEKERDAKKDAEVGHGQNKNGTAPR